MTQTPMLTTVFSVDAPQTSSSENATVIAIPKSKTIYLANPVADKLRGQDFQKKLESLGFEVINPLIAVPQGTPSGEMVERELRLIEKCDALVAIITPKARAAHMECFYAARILHRPVFVLYETQIDTNRITHPWYEYLTFAYLTEKELLNRLEKWRDE